MSDQTVPPTVPVTPPQQVIVVDDPSAPSKTQRAKAFAKLSFQKVGVPVLIGAAAAAVTTRLSRGSEDEPADLSDDTTTEE